jgi:hypothetical protein
MLPIPAIIDWSIKNAPILPLAFWRTMQIQMLQKTYLTVEKNNK